MPIFDYTCTNCGDTQECMANGLPSNEWVCSNCNKKALFIKQLSAPKGFILKGNGFYKPSAARKPSDPD